MNEIWISIDCSPSHSRVFHATVCPPCFREFLVDRRPLPVDGLGDEYFSTDDLLNARSVAIKPAYAFSYDVYPQDIHFVTDKQRAMCDACLSAQIVNHKERLVYAAEHASALAATGDGRDPRVLGRVTGLPWWFDYVGVFVSLIESHPSINTDFGVDAWSRQKRDSLRRYLGTRRALPRDRQ